MIWYRRFVVVFFVFFAVFSVVFAPFSAHAATECQCVCSAPGGTKPGQVTTLDKAASVCPKSCLQVDGKSTYQGCALTPEEVKEGSTLCWAQDECEARLVNVNGIDRQSEWANSQPRDCPVGKHYCYNPPVPVNLNIALNTLSSPKQASGLDEYLVAVYDFLIPASAIIAVVFIMIGGLQYVMARGDGGAIGKAKDRISKAVVGLVLVLAAYAIANFVDPRLTSFDALKVPVHRSAVFIEGDDCDDVVNQIRTVHCDGLSETQCNDLVAGIVERLPAPSGLSSGQCGTKCRIKEIPSGVFLAGVEPGDERFYTDCSHVSGDANCFESPSGDFAQCLRCWDVYPNNEFNLPASSAVCGLMDPVVNGALQQKEDGTYDVYGRCFATTAAAVVSGANTNAGAALTGGTCAAMAIQCSSVKSCDQYGDQAVVGGPPPDNSSFTSSVLTWLKSHQLFDTGETGDAGYLSDIDRGDVTYQSVCQLDPCGIGTCEWGGADGCVDTTQESGGFFSNLFGG